MKLPLVTRLALSYLAVILVGMAVVTPLAWLAVERLYLGAERANLLAQARLIASGLSGSSSPSAAVLPWSSPEPYSQTANVAPGIHTRVIDARGVVVIDLASAASPDAGLDLPSLIQDAGRVTPAELLARPEVQQALGGSAAAAVRRVPQAANQPVLYAAAPVLDGSGAVTRIVYLAAPLPDMRWSALPLDLRLQFAGVLLLVVLIASAAGLWFARGVARPLVRLAGAAGAVAGGDLAQSVPDDTSVVELSALSRAFNAMTASLRQADQSKNAFIAAVTHELRTPLTVIKGTIETLQDGAIDDLDARGPFLDSMDHETERLIRVVNDLLVLTRADAGALNLQLRAVDLAELARSRCLQMERLAQARHVQLEVVCPAEGSAAGVRVRGDADRLAQVLNNLLDNAIRYSPEGGTVTVQVQHEGSRVSCQVTDSGPGITAEHLPHIFERFYRADPARGRAQGGAGLGLSIVRELVSAHGGSVAAQSTPGQGATVTFWLPATCGLPAIG
jgi:two-component system, OmpR family, sensor histidine kinase BaeS